MNKLIYILMIVTLALGITYCSKKEEGPQKWEYKIISEWGVDQGNFLSKGIPTPEDKLNKLGDEGWELVDVYTRIETVHPNFGNSQYVTGLQPNTRTEAVFYVFKRPKTEYTDKKEGTVAADPVVVEEVVGVPADTCNMELVHE